MPFTTNRGVRRHWSGDPVLLVMGHLFAGVMWHPVLPALSARHRVVWFDNRGKTSSATVGHLGADARAVMDAAGLEQAHVYGVSMGGEVRFAVDGAALVLGCTAARSPTAVVTAPPGPFLGTLRHRIPMRLLPPVLRKPTYGPIAPLDAVEHDLDVLARAKISPRGVYAQNLAINVYDMTPHTVGQLSMPALVLHGTADQVVPDAQGHELARILPAARLVPDGGTGHHFVVDCTERANADVPAFLGS